MRRFAPMLVGGVMAVSFSALAFAQNTRDNVHYNIHQKGEQNSSQTGTGNQSSQVSGDQTVVADIGGVVSQTEILIPIKN